MVDYSVAEHKRLRLSADELKDGDIITVVQAMQVNEDELAEFNLQLIMETKKREIKYIVCEYCPRQPCPGCMLYREAKITRRRKALSNWRNEDQFASRLSSVTQHPEASFGIERAACWQE
jgi:hypothetical protein